MSQKMPTEGEGVPAFSQLFVHVDQMIAHPFDHNLIPDRYRYLEIQFRAEEIADNFKERLTVSFWTQV